MRKYAIIAIVVAAVFAMATLSQAAEKTAAPVAKAAAPVAAKLVPQTTCPVTGNPINKAVYTDYKGKMVYFCCPDCIAVFSKNPEKYLKVLADKGEEPAATPVTPVAPKATKAPVKS